MIWDGGTQQTKDDTLAILAAATNGDTDGVVLFMEALGIEVQSRVGLLIAGLCGFGVGMAMNVLEVEGYPDEHLRELTFEWISQLATQ